MGQPAVEVTTTTTILIDWLKSLKVGDPVVRMLAGTVPMELTVKEITDNKIICGMWEFDKKTGVEIDEDMGWGPDTHSGSYLQEKR